MGLFEKLKAVGTSSNAVSGSVEYIIVGLGNIGAKYDGTRHNVGFMALDALAKKYSADIKRAKFKALCGDVSIDGKRCLLLKPTTFMNNSGEAVVEAMKFHKIPIERVIIIFDDISLEPSFLRVRRKGSDGGHNGIKSIACLTASTDFPRIKIGVGQKPHPDYNLADWVLSTFKQSEREAIAEVLPKAISCVELIVAGKLDEAMNKYNS